MLPSHGQSTRQLWRRTFEGSFQITAAEATAKAQPQQDSKPGDSSDSDAGQREAFNADVAASVASCTRHVLTFFQKQTLNLFKRGMESDYAQLTLSQCNDLSMIKSILKQELLAYVKAEIGVPKSYNSYSMQGQVHSKTVAALHKNRELLEQNILCQLVKYKDMYAQVKEYLLRDQLSRRARAPSLDADEVARIKALIGADNFAALYPIKGLFQAFLPEYWKAVKLLTVYVKQGKQTAEHARVLVMETMHFLKHLLFLRLDALQQYESYVHRSAEDGLKRRAKLRMDA